MKTGDNKSPFFAMVIAFATAVVAAVLKILIAINLRPSSLRTFIAQVVGVIFAWSLAILCLGSGAYLYQSFRLKTFKPVDAFPEELKGMSAVKYCVSSGAAGCCTLFLAMGIMIHIGQISRQEEMSAFSFALASGVIAAGFLVWENIEQFIITNKPSKQSKDKTKTENDPLNLYENSKGTGQTGKSKTPGI